ADVGPVNEAIFVGILEPALDLGRGESGLVCAPLGLIPRHERRAEKKRGVHEDAGKNRFSHLRIITRGAGCAKTRLGRGCGHADGVTRERPPARGERRPQSAPPPSRPSPSEGATSAPPPWRASTSMCRRSCRT